MHFKFIFRAAVDPALENVRQNSEDAMKFGEKLKELRKLRGLTQKELAEAVGVSQRTIAGYESDGKYPRYREIYYTLAGILDVNPSALMTDEGAFITEASESYGSAGERQARELTAELAGLFAGGTIAQDDVDEMMKAIQDAYWLSKEQNRKYVPKKYRKEAEEG